MKHEHILLDDMHFNVESGKLFEVGQVAQQNLDDINVSDIIDSRNAIQTSGYLIIQGAVVIAQQLDLQLHMQSVPITTKLVSSNPVHGEVFPIQHYVIMFVS